MVALINHLLSYLLTYLFIVLPLQSITYYYWHITACLAHVIQCFNTIGWVTEGCLAKSNATNPISHFLGPP